MKLFEFEPSRRVDVVFGVLFFPLYIGKAVLSIHAVSNYPAVIACHLILSLLTVIILLLYRQWESTLFRYTVFISGILFFTYFILELVFLMPPLGGDNPFLTAFYGISLFLMLAAIGFCSFFFHPVLSAPLYTAGMFYFFLLRDRLPEASFLTFPHLAIFGTMVFVLFLLVRGLSKRFFREREMVRELAKTKERLIQQEKLSVLATFAAGIVHEISNPLTHMHGNLGFLAGYVDVLTETSKTGELPSRSPESLDFIHNDVQEILADYKKGFQRMKEITRSLKQFFRSREGGRDVIDLSGVLRTSVEYFVRYEALVEFISRIEDDLVLTCNAGDFLSVFQNILGNAVEAVEHKGTVWITARRNNGMLDFTFRDNGSGIPPEMIERIFDPFFSTKPTRENMGIGLTLCKNLIETYNGTLEVTSRGEGYTEVTVLIPAE